MSKCRSTPLAVVLLVVLLTAALAQTALAAGYDIYVNAKDNLGLNLREGPGTNYATVLPAPIPMYTKLHITSEARDSKGLPWGYTSYTHNGTTSSGWVCLVEISYSDPRPSYAQPTPTPGSTPVPTPTPPASPLDGIAYIGDRSKCALDKATCLAYANALAALPATGDWDGDTTYPQAVLVDVSGDGWPVLVTGYTTAQDYLDGSARVWTAQNGKATPYDFTKDCDFAQWDSSLSTVQFSGQPMLQAGINESGAIEPDTASLYYTVSKGQLTLDHTYHVKTDVATSESLFFLDGQSIGMNDLPTSDVESLAWWGDTASFAVDTSASSDTEHALRSLAATLPDTPVATATPTPTPTDPPEPSPSQAPMESAAPSSTPLLNSTPTQSGSGMPVYIIILIAVCVLAAGGIVVVIVLMKRSKK